MVVFLAWHTVRYLAADKVTWLNAATAITADGVASPTIPSGQYRVLVTGATGLFLALAPIMSPT